MTGPNIHQPVTRQDIRNNMIWKLVLLTHKSLAPLFLDMDTQKKPRMWQKKTGRPIWPIWTYSVCEYNEMKVQFTPDAPKNKSGPIQMIRMGKSICQKWFKNSSNC